MQSRATGWWVFAAILLGVSGILNLVWGIAAIGNSHFFHRQYPLHLQKPEHLGWITLIVGVIELFAAFSLFQGGGFGRLIGITAATLPRSTRF